MFQKLLLDNDRRRCVLLKRGYEKGERSQSEGRNGVGGERQVRYQKLYDNGAGVSGELFRSREGLPKLSSRRINAVDSRGVKPASWISPVPNASARSLSCLFVI